MSADYLNIPSWIRPLVRTSENEDIALGPTAGVYPTHPGQEEDVLNESNVKTGFSVPSIVGGSVG